MCFAANGEVVSTGNVREFTIILRVIQLVSAVVELVTNFQSSSRST